MTKKTKPKKPATYEERVQDLIRGACEAEDHFELDELEAFADEQALKRKEQP